MPRLNPFKSVPVGTRTKARPTLRLALVLSTAQQYTSLLVTLPSIMILSRLLTPAQIGVYSVAIAFVNLVHMLRDFGTSEYLVQAPNLDAEIARSAFTVTWIMAWSLAALLFVCSGWVAMFFDEQGLGSVLRILCLTYLLLPVGSTVNAMLIREMQFGIRYKIQVTELLTQNGVTIALAWNGFGYYSPAWGAVAGMVATVSGCFWWASEYRIRGISLKHWRPVVDFGVKKTGGTVMNRLGDSSPDFVIGRMLGFAQVGLFSRGFGLVRMFQDNVSGAVSSVVYSAFSQRHRDGENPAELFLRSITFITGIGWPFLGFASLMAFPIIRIFFGDQWDGAVPILRLTAIQVCIGIIVIHYQDLLTAIGRVGLGAIWTTAWQLVIIVTLVAAAFFGLVAVAASLIPATALVVLGVIIGLSRTTNLTLGDYARALWPSAVMAGCGLVPAGLVYAVYPPGPEALWGPLIASGVCLVIGCVVGGWLVRHPIWIEVTGFIQQRTRSRQPSPIES